MGQQQHLPTIEPTRFADVDEAAAKYVKIRDERMKLTQEEVEERRNLLAAMKAHNLLEYEGDDYKVVVKEGKPKIKVSAADTETEEDGDVDDVDDDGLDDDDNN